MTTQPSLVDLTDGTTGADRAEGGARASDVRLLLRAERDRTVAYLLIAAGSVAILSCWMGVSGTPFVADQLAYLASGGVGGLFLLALGLALMVSADHHDEWRKLDAIEHALGARSGVEPPAGPARDGRAAEGRLGGVAVLGVGAVTAMIIIGIGWNRAATTGDNGVSAQGITMSIAGLLVAVASTAGYLLPSRQRLSRRRAHLLRRFVLADALAGAAPGGAPAAGSDTVLIAEGLTRYHRAGCRAVDELAVSRVTRPQLDPRLTQCELCNPDDGRPGGQTSK